MHRTVGWVIAILLVIGGGFGAWMAAEFVVDDTRDPLIEEPQPIWAPIVRRPQIVEYEAQIGLDWEEGSSILAPAWTGIITAIPISPGLTVEEGTPLIVGDSVLRIGRAQAQPFHRDLRRGDRGPDVYMLNELLVRLGAMEELPDRADRYRSKTVHAVEHFEEQILGARRANGVFRAEWIIWLPTSRMDIGQLLVAVGEEAPPIGSPLATSPPKLRSAVVDELDLESFADLETITIEVSVGDLSYSVAVDGIVIPDELLALSDQIGQDSPSEVTRSEEHTSELQSH